MRNAGRLLRLYPRQWRRRYGDEFLALLESAELTRTLVFDVVRAAAHEWLVRTLTGRLVLGLAVSFAATLCALGLSATVPADPVFSNESGRTLVTPPWPVGLGVGFSIAQLAVALRVMVGIFRPDTRVNSGELALWTGALFVTSTGAQWGSMVLWLGTGIPARPVVTIWADAALFITTSLILLLLAARGYPVERGKVQSPFTPSSRPLGLS